MSLWVTAGNRITLEGKTRKVCESGSRCCSNYKEALWEPEPNAPVGETEELRRVSSQVDLISDLPPALHSGDLFAGIVWLSS